MCGIYTLTLSLIYHSYVYRRLPLRILHREAGLFSARRDSFAFLNIFTQKHVCKKESERERAEKKNARQKNVFYLSSSSIIACWANLMQKQIFVNHFPLVLSFSFAVLHLLSPPPSLSLSLSLVLLYFKRWLSLDCKLI